MKILAMGQPGPLLDLLEGARHRITHCTNGAQVISTLGNGDAAYYDMLVLEGQATAGEGAKVARAVRAMGYAVPIAFFTMADDAASTGAQTRLLCLVERTPQGRRVLDSVLVGTGGTAGPMADAGIVFEYQAPCRKRGRKTA